MERSSRLSPVVVSRDGLQGHIDPESLPLNEKASVPVQFEHGERLIIPVNFLNRQEDGTYVLPMTLAEAMSCWPATPGGAETLTIPVAEERLVRQTRKVETGRVRITKRVSTYIEEVDDPLVQETLHVERVAVNRPVDGPVPPRYEGDTLIIPVFEEILVVEKRLMLKEELHVTTRRTESRQPQQVALRREEVSVERIPLREPRETEREQPDVSH
ncbi:YsnF/AvaK domain-containing protein [Methylocaldum sp.]|uniref:YsnF/AvaK domain-containing protein n=1 Tax=Methylocaldum sp. TaxID=1969727 RepID=UPI002D3307BA|nr:YsnF/AvaK domain-containing protein [Methylocaldum sp.]HYE37306.1 YsnF/AvaK domain-containing protein [Methylocaldum sp.]